jgi:endonuclease/exonuclease/phosphatase family metal-dependent hydrolase
MPLMPARASLPRPRTLHATLLVLVLAATAALVLVHQPSRASAGARQTSEPFRVATFNILGASHTETRKRGFATYPSRMRKTVRLFNRRGFDIVGLQEYQVPQHELFLKLTKGSWGVYPGLEAGRRPVQNSIVWRTDEWTIVEKRLYKIPYFRGKLVQQPYIKLRHRQGGHEVWVINTHNPANSKGPAQHWRDEAMRIQADLANRLEATGLPVFLVGDFNERDEAFCAITGASDLKAANGGRWDGGVCVPPQRMRIDWIFLSRPTRVLSYKDLDNRVTRYISDHKVIFSDVAVPQS